MEQINRRDVLDAFERLVARHGLDRVTMKELAREAGISVGSIYRHFEGKDALVLAIEEKWRSHVEQRNSVILRSDRSPEEKLHDIIVRHVERFSVLVRENRAVHELLVGAIRLRYIGRTLDDTRRKVFDLMTAAVRGALEEGVRRGDFTVENVERTARLMVDAFVEFFSPRRIVEREHADLVQDADAMFELLMKAVRRT